MLALSDLGTLKRLTSGRRTIAMLRYASIRFGLVNFELMPHRRRKPKHSSPQHHDRWSSLSDETFRSSRSLTFHSKQFFFSFRVFQRFIKFVSKKRSILDYLRPSDWVLCEQKILATFEKSFSEKCSEKFKKEKHKNDLTMVYDFYSSRRAYSSRPIVSSYSYSVGIKPFKETFFVTQQWNSVESSQMEFLVIIMLCLWLLCRLLPELPELPVPAPMEKLIQLHRPWKKSANYFYPLRFKKSSQCLESAMKKISPRLRSPFFLLLLLGWENTAKEF